MASHILKTARLSQLFASCPVGHVVADIGTDHGFLPIALVHAGRAPRAIGCDVAAGPLRFARANLAEFPHLTDRVTLRLGDGLAPLHPNDAVDTVVIAGMGVHTIYDILKSGPSLTHLGARRLVVQTPQDGEPLRRWMYTEQRARIDDEVILRERGKLYHTLIADLRRPPARTWRDLSPAERIIGAALLERGADDVRAFIEDRLATTRVKITGLTRANSTAPLQLNALIERRHIYERALADMR